MNNKLRQIIALVFEIPLEKLPVSFTQNDIENWDSLRHLNLIVELESEYDVSFEPEEIAVMTSFESITDMINSKVSSN